VPLWFSLIYRQYLAFLRDQSEAYTPLNQPFKKSVHLKRGLLELAIHLFISVPAIEGKVCYYVMARRVCNLLSDLFMLISLLRLY
jgi:hypothetical protein